MAMRLEWPNEASAPGTAEGGFNQEQDSGDHDSHLAGPSAVPATEDDSGLDVH